MTEHPQDVTRLLEELRGGDPAAADRLAAVVFDQLHRIAEAALRRERDDHTLQATELVDEVFTRLVGQRETTWQNRAHFYGVAARLIRRILVDHARHRRRIKRDHGVRVTLDDAVSDERDGTLDSLDLIALDQALRQLETLSPRQGRVVELRFFAGLGFAEVAEALAVSPATVKRDWTFARAFLLQALTPAGS